MRVLITGITGFAGSHLAEHFLAQDGVEVFGTMRWRSRLDNLSDLAEAGKLNTMEEVNVTEAGALDRRVVHGSANLVECDLCDPTQTRHVVDAVSPDRVFHLAAQSFVPSSWRAPTQTVQTNVIGQLNLFEAIRAARIDPIIHVAGSSEQYGLVHEDEVPIKESNPFRPLSPYAVSKIAQEMFAKQYHSSYGLRTVVTRAFNHTGPRRGQVMVTSSYARQIAEMELGMKPPIIEVGDLTSQRDWTDVRDVVRAYALAPERCAAGDAYNVATGVGVKVQDMLDILLHLTEVDVEVRADPGRFRPSDVKLLCGDSSKFREATGWAPAIPFRQTMGDLLDYWRARVRNSRAGV